MKFFRSIFSSVPFLFVLLTALGYGLLLPFLGFYWDDWPFAWIAKFLGPREFIPAFMPFRPFLGPIFYLTTSLVPPVPLYWQIFALVIRFLIGFGIWWSLNQVWPKSPRISLTVALLLTVFPGYSQQYVALTHINQELIPFVFYVFSIGFAFKSLNAARPLPYIVIALLLQICGVFPTEYFFMFESVRFMLFFFHFQGNFLGRLKGTLRVWAPYLFVWMLNAAWLAYYYKFGPYNSYEISAAGNASTLNLPLEIVDVIWKVCFYVWGQIAVLLAKSFPSPTSIFTIGLILITFVFLRVFHIRKLDGPAEDRRFAVSLLVMGLVGILLGRIPSLAAELPLRLQSSYDRFMVSMMVSACFFVVGAIELIFHNKLFRSYITILLISFGVGQQFFNANLYRRDWQKQLEFYWQLSWRIPALRPDTVLLTSQLPTDYEPDLSFTAPLNWLYVPDYPSSAPSLPYALLYTEKRLGGPTLPSLEPGEKISFVYRLKAFHGNTSQAIVFYMPANGCLRVLDASRGDLDIYSKEPKYLTDAIPLSKPDLISLAPVKPMAPIFLSAQPPKTWCYYYERAELAHQLKEYKTTASLKNEADALGYKPEDPIEWLIFIDAHLRLGNLDLADKLSKQVIAEDARMRRGVCVVWKLWQGQTQTDTRALDAMSALQCP